MRREEKMTTMAKVFKSGNSQAIRLPKEFRFDCEEVEISRRGNEVILRTPDPKDKGLLPVLELFRALGEAGVTIEKDNRPPKALKGWDEV